MFVNWQQKTRNFSLCSSTQNPIQSVRDGDWDGGKVSVAFRTLRDKKPDEKRLPLTRKNT